jgi:hypothetical protein
VVSVKGSEGDEMKELVPDSGFFFVFMLFVVVLPIVGIRICESASKYSMCIQKTDDVNKCKDVK